MLCKKPFHKDGLQHGCGQCLPCLINRRRKWSHRLMLECALHKTSAFVTLTYERLPLCESVCTRHVQLFLKTLREKLAPQKIRFFAAGEYGDPQKGLREWNPHYHLALFGYPPCQYGQPVGTKQCLCPSCRLIFESWKKGRTFNGSLTPDSASYIAQYVTKKMTNKHDPRLLGRSPEFARMSNRPALGTGAMKNIANIVQGNSFALDDITSSGDVPNHLMVGMKKLPLDRTMKNKLRLFLGREEGLPDELLEELKIQSSFDRQELLKSVNYDYKKYGEKLLRTQLIRSVETSFKRKNL